MKLTHAEIIVKRIMLKHPLISQSRLAVLSQIFLRDPDAAWGEDGRIHVYNIKETNPRKAVMSMPEYVLQPIEIDKELQAIVPDFYAAQSVEREFERMQYVFIEKNIDVFAKKTLSHQHGLTAEVLTVNARNPLIFCIPDNVEASWKKAALEVIDAVIKALKDEKFISKSLNGERNDPLKAENWRTGYWASMYEKFYHAREKLSPNNVSPEAKAMISELWNSINLNG
jgi:hypothetical protein